MGEISIPEELLKIPSDQLVLPSAVEACAICKGHGSYTQLYNAGCGGGYYESIGPCDYCDEVGFRYKLSGDPVGDSIIAQIITLNQKQISEIQTANGACLT